MTTEPKHTPKQVRVRAASLTAIATGAKGYHADTLIDASDMLLDITDDNERLREALRGLCVVVRQGGRPNRPMSARRRIARSQQSPR